MGIFTKVIYIITGNFVTKWFYNVLCLLKIQVNGESVEENANLVIRLLIRRPECLGPALRGEGEGLLRAIIDANKVSYICM